MKLHARTTLALMAVLAMTALTAHGQVVTATQDELHTAMVYQPWGPGTIVSKDKDKDSGGVLYTVQLGSEKDGKFVWADWSGDVADWSGYEGFALEFEVVSTTGNGNVEVTNFLGDKDYKYHQPKGDWPVLGKGDSAVTYVDFADCLYVDNDGVSWAASLSNADLNKIDGFGWQVITNDDAMLGEQVQILVTPTATPEPATILVLGLGGAALAWKKKRR